ncbi:MAG: DNA adenine methylase [Neisseria animaloris]|uniref:DNA adenine methylase n=1 Tax=Neisseria animaloris TaxID=326522 RepID=UPI000D323BC5|nr:DNA adenine methylase [Neisseria animaloris]MDO5073795.1 DNA adenine methylase [Neisseria animaloris]
MSKNRLVAPVLKWVGGKRQLLPQILPLLPKSFSKYQYIEPFLGGGAVLFALQPKKALINDFNSELINVYRVIKEYPELLIADLKKHENSADYFYMIRKLDREDKFYFLSDIEKASRVIYLNKTCYNGLYRVNNSGEFNSPFGKYKNPNIVNEPTIRAVSNYLNKNNINILNGDYQEILPYLSSNSFVYLDPPYHPISDTSNFTGYIKGGWDVDDQIRLREFCDELSNKKIKFLLSNSKSSLILEEYKKYDIRSVQATRLINSNAANRGNIDEVLIKNYEI